MAGGAQRARGARGGAGSARRGNQAEAARAPLGTGGQGLRVRHRGRQEAARRAVRRPLAAAGLQHHVRPGLPDRSLPRVHEPRRRVRGTAAAHEQARCDPDLLLARADRPAGGLPAADGLAVPVRVDLRQRLPVRLRACSHRAAGRAGPRAPADGAEPAGLAPVLGRPGRRPAHGRPARESRLHRVRARERNRVPHLHGHRTRPVRRTLLQLPARPDAEAAAGRAAQLPQGRIPGLRPGGAFERVELRRAVFLAETLAAYTARVIGSEQIRLDDPRTPDVRALLKRHLTFALSTTPPEHSFALDVDGLLDPAITFFSLRAGGELLGIGAIKQLDAGHAEIKSMHTAQAARGRGVGRAMLNHLLTVARFRGCARVSLETGTMEEFAPARALYSSAGFTACGPFADYRPSPDNCFMTLALGGR